MNVAIVSSATQTNRVRRLRDIEEDEASKTLIITRLRANSNNVILLLVHVRLPMACNKAHVSQQQQQHSR